MFLGIEIGGTKLQLGVGSGDAGELAAIVRHDVDPRQGATAILDDAHACNRFVSQREADDLAHAAAFVEERRALQHEQIQRLRELLPLPQIELPFVFNPDITRPQLDTLADAFARGIEQL